MGGEEGPLISSVMRRDYLAFGKPSFSEEEVEAVARVLRSGWVGMGPETAAFERELEEFLGAPCVVTVNSCTSALFLALLLHGVGPDDEVICPSLTWCSTANAALYLGAKPVFCDVDPDTLCSTPETIRERLTPRTKAVVVVHMGGFAVEVDAIRAVLPDGVAVVEDAAHALGARFADGTPVGSSGNLTCFSFYANKNLSTGEGGAIALFDEGVAGRLRMLRQHAMPADAWKRYIRARSLIEFELAELGYKMNYTDLQAAIGRVQLRRQGEFREVRLAVATRYAERLSAMSAPVALQAKILDPAHARHLLVVRLPVEHMRLSRDELLLALRDRNVGASIHYPPLHRMALYGNQPAVPVTEALYDRIMTLPISAAISPDDADYVADQVGALLAEGGKVTV